MKLSELIRRREDLPNALNQYGLTGEGAEIGVWRFDYANVILKTWRGLKYHCVDPGIKQPPSHWRGEISQRNDWDELWLQAQDRARRDSRIVLHRTFSELAAPGFPDASLDWVYLDGNHARAHVSQDLELWWPKLKPGGILGGHDYVKDSGPPHYLEVKQAVDEWMHRRALIFFVTVPCTSWWTRKPL